MMYPGDLLLVETGVLAVTFIKLRRNRANGVAGLIASPFQQLTTMIVDGAVVARRLADVREDAYELPNLNLCRCAGNCAACDAIRSPGG
jgi:hypothetical protein